MAYFALVCILVFVEYCILVAVSSLYVHKAYIKPHLSPYECAAKGWGRGRRLFAIIYEYLRGPITVLQDVEGLSRFTSNQLVSFGLVFSLFFCSLLGYFGVRFLDQDLLGSSIVLAIAGGAVYLILVVCVSVSALIRTRGIR